MKLLYLDLLFSDFKWYRKLKGGHWEQWWIGSPVCSTVWIQQTHGDRPGLGVSCDKCEDYHPSYASNLPYR